MAGASSGRGVGDRGASGIAVKHFMLTGISVNAATTDVGTFTGLPPRYTVTRLVVLNASVNLTLATLELRNAAAGAGSAIVAAAALSALTAAAKVLSMTVAIPDVQTAASLVVRNVTPQAAPATVDIVLEVIQLP